MTIIKKYKSKIKNRIRKILIKNGKLSYSQAGEDLILDCIFLSKMKGIYIDVGANHPFRASNTYFFYRKGWTGFNIDALDEAIDTFNGTRKKDINILTGVNDIVDELDFYIFKESSYNTFNKEVFNQICKIATLKEIKKIPVKPLSKILAEYEIESIDFLSVDVEGLDLNVLKSNDWVRFRPKIVLVEEFENMNGNKSSIYEFMSTINYSYFCRTVTNSFYIENTFYNERFLNKK